MKAGLVEWYRQTALYKLPAVRLVFRQPLLQFVSKTTFLLQLVQYELDLSQTHTETGRLGLNIKWGTRWIKTIKRSSIELRCADVLKTYPIETGRASE